MVKLFEYVSDNGYRDYYSTETLPSGQAIRIEFQEGWSKKIVYFNIFLVIKNKNKSPYPALEQTGKDGLKGLIWAKQKVLEFEEFIKADIRYENSKIILFCRWEDNRRRNAYHRGLKNEGYKYGMVYGAKAIFKQI